MNLEAKSLFSIEGKTALLTGANGFLGQIMARALLANGANLVALGRSESLKGLVSGWESEFGKGRVRGYQVDMYQTEEFRKVLGTIERDEPFIEVLVNNAHEIGPETGFNCPEGTLEESTIDQWIRNLTGGVYWASLATQVLGRQMKTAGRGSIINISTMYALVAPSPHLYKGTKFINPPGYSASKAALLGFTRYVASFWGSCGIRSNAILPGPISNTREPGPNAVGKEDPFLSRLADRTCLGRIGRPEELAGALLFLASDASSYVTGHALVVDGGWTIT